MKLYYSPGACSLSVNIALREAAHEFQSVKVDMATRALEDGRPFQEIEPRGYVPVLELDSGERMTEVVAILQFVANLAAPGRLMPPAGTMAYFHTVEWLAYTSSELHKGFGPLFNPSLPAAVRADVTARLRSRLSWADEKMRGRNFLVGETFTVADAYLFAILGFAQFVHMTLTDWPSLYAYAGRIMHRPAVQAAMRSEGLLG
jgi:glutathione S-transferase